MPAEDESRSPSVDRPRHALAGLARVERLVRHGKCGTLFKDERLRAPQAPGSDFRSPSVAHSHRRAGIFGSFARSGYRRSLGLGNQASFTGPLSKLQLQRFSRGPKLHVWWFHHSGSRLLSSRKRVFHKPAALRPYRRLCSSDVAGGAERRRIRIRARSNGSLLRGYSGPYSGGESFGADSISKTPQKIWTVGYI